MRLIKHQLTQYKRYRKREHPAVDALAGCPFLRPPPPQINLDRAPGTSFPCLRDPPKPAFSSKRGDAGSAAAGTPSRPRPSHPGPAQAAPPPRRPAADKAAPRLPARLDQALHKAPHFRPAPAPEPPPPGFPDLPRPAPPGPARAGPSRHGVWLGDGQCPHDAQRRPTAGPRAASPLAWPRPGLPPTLRRHRSPRPHFRPPRAGRGRAGHVTQRSVRARDRDRDRDPGGVREVPGCWGARPGSRPLSSRLELKPRWERRCRKC